MSENNFAESIMAQLIEERDALRAKIVHLLKDKEGTSYEHEGARKEIQFLVRDEEEALEAVVTKIGIINEARESQERRELREKLEAACPEDPEVEAVEALDQLSKQLGIMEKVIDHPKFEEVMVKLTSLSFRVLEKSGFIEKITELSEKVPPQRIQLVGSNVVEPAKVS